MWMLVHPSQHDIGKTLTRVTRAKLIKFAHRNGDSRFVLVRKTAQGINKEWRSFADTINKCGLLTGEGWANWLKLNDETEKMSKLGQKRNKGNMKNGCCSEKINWIKKKIGSTVACVKWFLAIELDKTGCFWCLKISVKFFHSFHILSHRAVLHFSLPLSALNSELIFILI